MADPAAAWTGRWTRSRQRSLWVADQAVGLALSPACAPAPRQEPVELLELGHDAQAEANGERGVVGAQHQRVADRLDLLGAVLAQQRANVVVEEQRDIGGAIVALSGSQGRVADEIAEEKS